MSAPVHVLMLPSGGGGGASSAAEAMDPALSDCLLKNEGDYLDLKDQFAKRQKVGALDGHQDATAARDPPGQKEDDAAVGGSRACDLLWSGASPVEIAIAQCCDHEDPEGALLMTAAAAGSSALGGADDGRRCGSVSRGSEGQFAALIMRHCHTAGDRALALAVLQRTIELDEAFASRPAQKKNRKRGAEQAKVSAQVAGSTKTKKGTELESKSDGVIDSHVNGRDLKCRRMENFLFAGGLKVLNHWLTDAFTPVPAGSSLSESKERGRKKNPAQISGGIAGTMTSPTGVIILPLLSILQSIPFNIELVKDSQINKQIKKLKKSLDKLVANFDEDESESDSESFMNSNEGRLKSTRKKRSLEGVTHPVSGGMPVVQVHREVEKLMQIWKDAALDESGKGEADFYKDLCSRMEERLQTLNKYEAGEAEKPPWLVHLEPHEPKPPSRVSSVSTMPLQKNRAEELKRLEASKRLQQQQADLKAAQVARQEATEKMETFRKRMLLREDGSIKKWKVEAVAEEDPMKKKGTATRREDGLTKKRKVEDAAKEESPKKKRTATRREDGSMKKVKIEAAAEEEPPKKKRTATCKVTWADQKATGVNLVEVREFVPDPIMYQNEEEEKSDEDNNAESDKKYGEDGFQDGDDDDVTQGTSSVDSGPFDNLPPNEEDANLSQEKEAGSRFETQEPSKGVCDKSAQLNEDSEDDDGWETVTYDP